MVCSLLASVMRGAGLLHRPPGCAVQRAAATQVGCVVAVASGEPAAKHMPPRQGRWGPVTWCGAAGGQSRGVGLPGASHVVWGCPGH